MSDAPKAIIVPTVRDVAAWRLTAEAFINSGGGKLGELEP